MTQSAVTDLFKRMENKQVLIIGDVMLDAYLWGQVERISPESPVPVVDVQQEEYRLGGAGNVARNIQSLGANPILFGAIGDDGNGYQLRTIMEESGMTLDGIFTSKQRLTTTKTRVLGRNQQMLRVDRERRDYLKGADEKAFLQQLENYFKDHQVEVVIMQDYNKGVLTKKIIQQTIRKCRELAIPVAVDPKEKNFFNFSHVNLFKPNLKELNDNLNLHLEPNHIEAVEAAMKRLHKKMQHETTLVTLSSNGMIYFDGRNSHHLAGHPRSVADVSGAGDTVISVASLGYAARLDLPIAFELANLAGGLVCEEVGVVPVDREKLMQEAEEKV